MDVGNVIAKGGFVTESFTACGAQFREDAFVNLFDVSFQGVLADIGCSTLVARVRCLSLSSGVNLFVLEQSVSGEEFLATCAADVISFRLFLNVLSESGIRWEVTDTKRADIVRDTSQDNLVGQTLLNVVTLAVLL